MPPNAVLPTWTTMAHRWTPAYPLSRRRIVLGLPLIALAACGDDAPAPSPSPSAAPTSAVDVLSAASARIAGIQTIRFSLDIEGQTFVDSSGTIELLSATGSLVRPASVDTEFKVKVLRGLTFSVRMIVLGAERWTTDLVTGEWGPAPVEFDYDPGVIFDTADGIGPILSSVTGAVLGEDETIGDRPCRRVDAQIEESIIRRLTGGTMQGTPVAVQLWVDRESTDLRRVILREPSAPDGRAPAAWTLDFSDHGEPITIDRPVVDAG